jgi:hypothetical protein
MCRIGFCPACRKDGLILTKHHKWKRAVWGRDKKKKAKIVWLCRNCHDEIEAEITRRENALLKSNPEIYIGTLNEFLRGERNESSYKS